MWPSRRATLAALFALAAAAPAGARTTFCCNDADGRRLCGDVLPPACYNRPYHEVNRQGMAVRRVEPLTPEQRALQEAEEKQRKEEERRAAEQKRRDNALLATYPDVGALDAARDRALAEAAKGVEHVKALHEAALKRRQELGKEAEFYLKAPMPPGLRSQIQENEIDLKAQEAALESRKKELEALRARFDEERRHYLELRQKRSGSPAPAVDNRPR